MWRAVGCARLRLNAGGGRHSLLGEGGGGGTGAHQAVNCVRWGLKGKRRWAAAEEGQGWWRQQRARASLGSSCAPQEGSNLGMVAIDGQSQSCFPTTEAACVSSCKQHKPSRADSPQHRSEVSPRFHQQAHSGLITSTSCPHKRSAAPAHKRMRREQPQNNATQHHQHCSHRQQQRGRVTCPLHSRQPGTREAGARWTHNPVVLPS